jgi:hypothetical protein
LLLFVSFIEERRHDRLLRSLREDDEGTKVEVVEVANEVPVAAEAIQEDFID